MMYSPSHYKEERTELISEIIGSVHYPVVSNFDCSHCVPMISIPQLALSRLIADGESTVSFQLLDGGIE